MAQSLTLLAQDSPRSGHLHVLPLDCRPRGFSPPRRFRLHARSGIVAPQPDRIRTVASSLLGLSSRTARSRPPKPCHQELHTKTRSPNAFALTSFTGGPILVLSPLPELRRTPPMWTDGRTPLCNSAETALQRLVGRAKIAFPGTRAPFEELHSRTAEQPSLTVRAPSSLRCPPSLGNLTRPRGLLSVRKTRPQSHVAVTDPESSPSMGF